MLRKIRISLAIIFYIGITALLLDFTGTLHVWLGWMAKVQFLPALLALNLGVIGALVVLTLLLGRVYCSVICPLGVMQDIFGWLGKRQKKNRYRYSPAKNWLRYSLLVLFVIALVAGVGSFVALLAPYGSYGRIVQNLLAPLWQWGNNLLNLLAEHFGSYAFYPKQVWLKSVGTLVVAALTFVAIGVLAWRGGRTYCNTVCPVGSVLGLLSRYSLFKPVIDRTKCVDCNLCARNCKASCIDIPNHRIDYSRCVACMDCIDKCNRHAISYTCRRPAKDKSRTATPTSAAPRVANEGLSRRTFLSLTALFTASTVVKAQEKTLDGGYAVIVDKKIPPRRTPIVPAGAVGLRNMATHCTGCQLCVSVCPNHVLRPSRAIKTFMQPESSYERGYCRSECTKCSEVCPAGAIRPIDTVEKSSIQVGHAVWIKENCIPLTVGDSCNSCEQHCPAQAITMVLSDASNPDSPKIPVVNEERCTGCGACEYLCPARPFSAIYVEGHEQHRII